MKPFTHKPPPGIFKHGIIVLILMLCVLGILKEALYEVHKLQTSPGFAIDDAWIHARLARNLINGNGFGMNPGEWVPMSTAPLWTLLLAFFMLIFRDPVVSALVLATCAQTATLLLMYRLMYRYTGSFFWSMVPAALLTFHPVILWGFPSGMEHPVVILSILCCLSVFENSTPDSRKRKLLFPLTLAACALSRPELLLLAPAGFLVTFFQNLKRQKENLRPAIQTGMIQAAVFTALLLPYFLFNYALTDHLFPTAFYVKAKLRGVGVSGLMLSDPSFWQVLLQLFNSGMDELINVFKKVLSFHPVFFMLTPLGFCALKSEKGIHRNNGAFLLFTLVFLFPLALGISVPSSSFSNYANRYLTPYIPPLFILQGLGLWWIWEKSGMKSLAVTLLVLGCVFSVKDLKHELSIYARDVKNTLELYVKSGRWLEQELEPGVVIAVNDVGGISYFSHHPLVDIMGLGSVDIWPYLARGTRSERIFNILAYMREHHIDYLLISPKYYPNFNRIPGLLEKVKVWPAAYPTGRSISPQVLYKVHWEVLPQTVQLGTDISGS